MGWHWQCNAPLCGNIEVHEDTAGYHGGFPSVAVLVSGYHTPEPNQCSDALENRGQSAADYQGQ